MPPVFRLDAYEACIHADNDAGIYCSVNFDLVTDEPSELYDMIRNYSAKTETHFNHSKLFYGVCLTKTCTKFYKQNTTEDLNMVLEACLNESLWDDYKLKARIEKYTCDDANNKIWTLDTADIVVGAVIAVILMFNLIGSLQEICCSKSRIPLVSCFSVQQNWRRLIAPAEGPDPRLTRLKGFHGLKAIMMLLVVMLHSLFPFAVSIENTHTLEESYNKSWGFQILANGSIIMQTFFLLSGFLLVYNMQLQTEKHKITWLSVPKIIIYRYLRMTLPYMMALAVIATWMRHFGYGPLWQSVVVREVTACRKYWWLHPLYLNNYLFAHSFCMVETWFLAADFQLYVVGVFVCVLTAGRCRRVVLGLLFAAGVVLPAVITYNLDLDGIMIFSPENIREFFTTYQTFIHVYKRAHTNVSSFVIGCALGLLVHHWQTTDFKFQNTVRHRIMMWLSFPAMLALIYLGNVSYMDSPRLSVYIRAAIAGLQKPVFDGIVGYFIVGMVFKFEDFCRGILEWDGWRVISRVSYSTFLIHFMIIRTLTGLLTNTGIFSLMHVLENSTGTIALCLGAAIVFHLLVEAPSVQLVKLLISGQKTDETEKYPFNESSNKDLVLNSVQINCGQNTQLNNGLKGILTKNDNLNTNKSFNKTPMLNQIVYDEPNGTKIINNGNQNEIDDKNDEKPVEPQDRADASGTKADSTKAEDTLTNGDLKEKKNGNSDINGVAKDIQNGVNHRKVIADVQNGIIDKNRELNVNGLNTKTEVPKKHTE